ncbi:MAG: hypothetical protein G01um101470_468 [Parcubacteria group bacterium Gr01-1014_70]|nr:MAG: hypothetical protein G01um101470_468 [Parcubacteria group bacterium Gr01-1014_70]
MPKMVEKKSVFELDFEALKSFLHGMEYLEGPQKNQRFNADGEALLANADNRATAFWEEVFESNRHLPCTSE